MLSVFASRFYGRTKGYLIIFRRITMRVLNVAEKNDVAKNLSEILSKGRSKRREGLSKYNKIYEFESQLFNTRCHMIVTSVSGHLMTYEFTGNYKSWRSCDPVSLFEAPLIKKCPPDSENIKKTLQREVRNCEKLVIWTDCDREGENIGFEIIQVCREVKPNLEVRRARFSEITVQSITRACNNLEHPNEQVNNAVDVRQELDLRIGAAFTRFQTLRLQRVFPGILDGALVSYGSCQFPTLGFVVERYKQVQAFISEPFWKITVLVEHEDGNVEFSWRRVRLFNHTACLVLFHICQENPTATVVNVQSKRKTKWRPLPLDTIELEKSANRKLHMNAKTAMSVAEKLYTQGYISYPRTETNIFPKELDLRDLISKQTNDNSWGDFARGILESDPNPRQGTKTDNAHPPIHPTKYAANLQGNEKRLYEFVVRHFLACCSKDAEGVEVVVEIDVAEERFVTNGLTILARNYLDVYPYEKWNTKTIPTFELGQTFEPAAINMVNGQTTAPPLLTEADLIALMDKHGIGTDATHAEHIETIKQRMYVGLESEKFFLPGELGMGLVEGYDAMGFAMSKPNLRAELEADLKRICEGTKDPRVVLREQIASYRRVFVEAVRQSMKLDEALGLYFGAGEAVEQADFGIESAPSVSKCVTCNSDLVLKKKKDQAGFYISCLSYPDCKSVIWLPECIEHASIADEICDTCGPATKKLQFRFKSGSLMPFFPNNYLGCLGGCEPDLLECLNVKSLKDQIRNPSTNGPIPRQTNQASRSNIQRTNPRPANNQPSIQRHANNQRTNQMPVNNQRINQTPANNRPANRKTSTTKNNSIEDDEIVCGCGEVAIQLTVKKDGPNKGRNFYKCARPQGTECNFFAWADDRSSVTNQTRVNGTQQQTNRIRNDDDGGDSVVPMCGCNVPAKRLQVQKEGANQGRWFFTCSRTGMDQCRFFQWDEPNANVRPTNDTNRNRRSAGGGGGRRRCGNCGETGHNRKTCPRDKTS